MVILTLLHLGPQVSRSHIYTIERIEQESRIEMDHLGPVIDSIVPS